MSTVNRTTRLVRTATAVALLGLAGSAGTSAMAAEARTETGLAGYELTSAAAPLRILLDDPSVPIPRPPDAPILEGSPSYTTTSLSTGPTGRGLASTLWPGDLIGTGLPQVAPGAPDYPFKAEATFPGGEPTAEQSNGPSNTKASAMGLDVAASATTLASPIAAVVDLGSAQSVSRSTVEKDIAITSTVSSASDVVLAGGLIRVKNVTTLIEARSDGKAMSSSGSSVVSGLEIAGMGYTVDESGVRPVQEGQPGAPLLPALPPGIADPLQMLGITVIPPTQTETVSDTTVNRTAAGLQIVLNTQRYNEALNTLPLRDLVEAIPNDELRSQLFFLLGSTPEITFVFGAGTVSAAAASLLELPPLPPLEALPPLTPLATGSTGSDTGLASSVLSGGTTTPSFDSSLSPDLALPGSTSGSGEAGLLPATAPAQAGSGELALFGGISPAVLLLGLLATGLGARGLVALNGLLFGLGALARGCPLGADENLPDLRTA